MIWRFITCILLSNAACALKTNSLFGQREDDDISRIDHIPGFSIDDLIATGSLLPRLRPAELKDTESTATIRRSVATGNGTVPATSKCIVIVVVQWMIIYTALAVHRTYLEFTGDGKGNLEAGLKAAQQTMTYGPMLCVLFIACRLRVQFVSNGTGEPQLWVQYCMYAVTFAVFAQTLAVLLIPLITGRPIAVTEEGMVSKPDLEACRKNGESPKSDFEVHSHFYALSAFRYIMLLCTYLGLVGVITGMCTYAPPGQRDPSKIPPPAPAVLCTIILAITFFLIQLVIAGCRSYTELMGIEFPQMISVMNAASTTVEFAPMISIVFLAARMRALQHGGEPQVWAQSCMFAATAAVCATTILAIIVPLVMSGEVQQDPTTKAYSFKVKNELLGHALMGARFLCLLGIYGGTVGVIYSIFAFEAPAGHTTLPVSPTVQCVINLTSQFFFVYLVVIVCHTVSELTGGMVPLETYRFYTAVETCRATLAFAPMLSILFITTRMYALQITDQKGAPPSWVQDGMFMATWALMISFLSCLTISFIMDDVKTNAEGHVVNDFKNPYVARAVTALRYFTMLLLYVGIVTVVIGLFTMTPETANGRGSIPVLSDAVNATPLGHAPPGPNHAMDEGIAAEKRASQATGLANIAKF